MLHITKLPEDILFSIVEFINPRCSQERVNIICEIIVPVLPFLTKHFQNKHICDEADHAYLDKTYCVHTIPRLDNDFHVHRQYFRTILKTLFEDLLKRNVVAMGQIHSKKKYKSDAYTFHFPDNMTFHEHDPILNYIIHTILPQTPFAFSHMCCSGSGLFAESIL